MARFAGGEPTPLDKDARLLALGAKLQFNASILVSKMLGLRSIAAMRARTDLAHGAQPAAAPWQGAVWVDEAGVEWQELGLAGLVQDERFLQIGR